MEGVTRHQVSLFLGVSPLNELQMSDHGVAPCGPCCARNGHSFAWSSSFGTKPRRSLGALPDQAKAPWLLLNLADANLTHCLPDSRINMQAGLGIAGSAGPFSAVTFSAPEKVRISFLVGHPERAYFLVSEIEQEPGSLGLV